MDKEASQGGAEEPRTELGARRDGRKGELLTVAEAVWKHR